MNLLEAYAHQVAAYHPKNVRDELFAEIYDEICEEFADAQKTNPALTEVEFLDANKQHPIKYATRLAPGNSACLIGPQFYFSFLSTLKNGATITATLFLAIAVFYAAVNENSILAFLSVLYDLPEFLLWVSAAILGIYVAMEKSGDRATWLDNWSAADLKKVDSHQSISKSECFFDLSLSIIALLWIFDVIRFPLLISSEGVRYANWQALLPDVFWIVLAALFLVDAGFSLYRLTRDLWTQPLRLVMISISAMWLAVGFYLMSQPQLMSLPTSVPQPVAELEPLINNILKAVVAVIMLIVAWDIFTHLRHLLRDR